MILSLNAYAGSGKDSLADVLVRDYGYRKYAWADTLRLAAEAINPIVGLDVAPDDLTAWKLIRYNDAVAEHGYTRAKELFPALRDFLQKLGTDFGRNMVHDNIWVNATLERIDREVGLDEDAKIVFTDTRFPNEAEAVKQLGGFNIRITRDGIGPANDHISEVALDDYSFDARVTNNGTLDELANEAGMLISVLSDPDF